MTGRNVDHCRCDNNRPGLCADSILYRSSIKANSTDCSNDYVALSAQRVLDAHLGYGRRTMRHYVRAPQATDKRLETGPGRWRGSPVCRSRMAAAQKWLSIGVSPHNRRALVT